MNLTHKEVETLIESLDKWEQSDIGEELVHGLFGSMIAKDDPIAKAEFEKEQIKRKEEQAIKERARKKTASVIKAKLYEYQDNIVDNEIKSLAGAPD